MFKTILATAIISTISFSSFADWGVIKEESSISFTSVKKQHISEAHHFDEFSGTLTEQGKFTVAVSLASVETGITKRNERMKQHLFNVSEFANATISADVSRFGLEKMAVGETKKATVPAKLTISGSEKKHRVNVIITRSSDQSYFIASAKPIVIRASDHSLISGIDKLKALAKLPSIGYSVPVSFALTLRHIP